MDIRFVPQEEVNRQLYNSCVHFATNGTIYGYDWFLNNTARDWDVLVEGDDQYFSVLPLPHGKNWLGRSGLVQPRLVPELALYSVRPLSPKRVQAFWDAVPKQFRSGQLTLEPWSIPPKSRFDLTAAGGTLLDLKPTYEEVIDDFPPAYFSELAKADLADLIPTAHLKPERLAAMYRQIHGAEKHAEWSFHAYQRLMYQALHRGWGAPFGIQNRQKEVLAAFFLLYSHGRIFPLLQLVTPAGAQVGARIRLWDDILRGHSNRTMRIKREEILDASFATT
ncbi:MAG: hypothetical protein AAF828_00540 [Bacteroidota bacterium]